MAQITEGFLCPICMADLGDVIQLQLHFDERHSKEDPAFVQNLKDLFGKAKQKIKKGFDDGSNLLGNELSSDISNLALSNNLQILNENQQTVSLYGTQYSSNVHPVSGILNSYLEESEIENVIPVTNYIEYYRTERAKRADMLAMDTNKLIIRLEKLMSGLPHDPVKRRSHEQAIVSWLPEESVKLCPNCARSFNLTRRKHHCRLCGSIMCADCSDYVPFELARRLINPATISKYESNGEYNDASKNIDGSITKSGHGKLFERSKLNPSYDNLAKNFADLTGMAEAQQQFRSCTFCAESLKKRDARVSLTADNQSPVLQRYYEKLRQLMQDGTKMSKEYREIAEKLNAGEPATKLTIEEAKRMRIHLLKAAENVDAVSKAMISLDEDDSSKTLRSRIRAASINFVKETLIGLPGIPSEQEHAKLQEERKKEAAKRIQLEQKAAATAKMKYDQEMAKRSSKLAVGNPSFGINSNCKTSPRSQRQSQKPKGPTVQYGSGFVSSTSRAKHNDTDDPIVLQMSNLREFINQARTAGKHDDAKLLEENLRDLQEEYQRQRKQLEENYNSFKDVFGKKPTERSALPNEMSPGDLEDEFDENNPFFVGPDDEMNELEKVLKSEGTDKSNKTTDVNDDLDETNPFHDPVNEEKLIADGSVDFDEYDQSGRNPFF